MPGEVLLVLRIRRPEVRILLGAPQNQLLTAPTALPIISGGDWGPPAANQSTPTSLIAHSLSDNDTPARLSPPPAAVGHSDHSSSSVIVRFISRFDGTAVGSSILRAASAPATGSFAGSSSPSCTRAEAWSQWMCSWWILPPSK